MVPVVKQPGSLVWVGLATPRVESFCWLVVLGKAATTDVLRRRGILLENN